MDPLPVWDAILYYDCNGAKRVFLPNFRTEYACCVKKNIDVNWNKKETTTGSSKKSSQEKMLLDGKLPVNFYIIWKHLKMHDGI